MSRVRHDGTLSPSEFQEAKTGYWVGGDSGVIMTFDRCVTYLARLAKLAKLAGIIAVGTIALAGTRAEAVLPLEPPSALSLGFSHSCALFSNGTVSCWGLNDKGQLGNGTKKDSSIPVKVSGMSDAVQLSVGGSHSCVVMLDATARCWGLNKFGQLGSGDKTDASTPVPVIGLTNVAQLSSGNGHSCAVLLAGKVLCWGSNSYDELGNGDENNVSSTTPVAVVGLSNPATKVSVGLGNSSCAVLDDATVACWGQNEDGQLGNGTQARKGIVPTAVSGLTGVTDVEVGLDFACALKTDSTAFCWGHNDKGQLGDGTTATASSPVKVRLDGIRSLVAQGSHVCALLAAGTPSCWGGNDFGQIGDGTNKTPTLPQTMTTANGFSRLAVGADHTCAVVDATARCWGANTRGQLGDGTTVDSRNPVEALIYGERAPTSTITTLAIPPSTPEPTTTDGSSTTGAKSSATLTPATTNGPASTQIATVTTTRSAAPAAAPKSSSSSKGWLTIPVLGLFAAAVIAAWHFRKRP